ncbi:hypothetical protein C2W59_00303 [Bacillus pumilus]|nr:hypothetical protein C2W59_00303 [Bacillus pumilus]
MSSSSTPFSMKQHVRFVLQVPGCFIFHTRTKEERLFG